MLEHKTKHRKFLLGQRIMALSVISRIAVLVLLCALAMMTEYLNYKVVHNHPRLVELEAGEGARRRYEAFDWFFSKFGDPVQVAQSNGGMTWSIRIMGVPFTDPIAALSVLAKSHQWNLGFAMGLVMPVGIAVLFGRVFCSYVCPASLMFFSIARLRRLLSKVLFFPELKLHRAVAWGVLCGGILTAVLSGYGVWVFLLPYFAIGQTVFHGLAFGTISAALIGVAAFAIVDLLLGSYFTCRYLCPTGRLLGFLGRKSVVSIRRDESDCIEACHSCHQVCPMLVDPKLDETIDCSLCGECVTVCPSQCLSVGIQRRSVDA
jgi:ferredoxin-type protein NapH